MRFAEALVGTRFLLALPSFLRNPVDLPTARAIVARRRGSRASTFLAKVRRCVYEHKPSPYRQLLHHAGCEYGDIERLVRDADVEGALAALAGQGVYLTVDEFKGRRPLIRGSTTITVEPESLRNPSATFHFPARSGGSRSAGTPVLMDMSFVRGCGVNTSLLLDAWGATGWQKADWETPGAGARFRLLKLSSFGTPPVRWFSQVDPGGPGLDATLRWSGPAMRWGGRLAGVSLPAPELAPVDNPLPVVRWMAETLRAGDVPFIFTFPSSAVRACQTALAQGIDIRGARILMGGEPTTEARLAVIRAAGVHALPRYGSMECGPVAYGCLAPDAPDDVHLLHDLHALIQAPDRAHAAGALPRDALLISSLHPAAPFVLLNVSMGDRAVMGRRACGCPLEQLGYETHLHEIRSYEKLTAEGMTFLDADVTRILEEELPARFGGSPTDYQLLEDQTDDGLPRLRLRVHPRLGSLEPNEVTEAFLAALGSGSRVERVMEVVWGDADLLQVEREAPVATSAGKILHLHVER